MAVFLRHFISQKLGRASATVEFTEGAGTVVIATTEPPGSVHRFDFEPAGFARPHDGDISEELVVRTAVAQLHRNLQTPSVEAPTTLVPGIAPWIGDFTDSPSGSGTGGYQRRLSEQERRNPNGALNLCVEQGVSLLRSRGRPEARCYLQNASVPPSVIRRVLSNSVARRKA